MVTRCEYCCVLQYHMVRLRLLTSFCLAATYSALFLIFVAFGSEYIVEEVERVERFEKM